MKVKWIRKTIFLQGTNGKIYDVLEAKVLGKTKQTTWYKIKDDSNDTYWYPEGCFEVVEN